MKNIKFNLIKILWGLLIFMSSVFGYFIVYEKHNNENAESYFVIVYILLIIIISTYKSYKCNDLLQPITIINIFTFFIFVARPIQVIWGDAILNDDHVFKVYNNIHGINNYKTLPFFQALLIGAIGITAINIGYFVRIRNKNKEKSDFNYLPILRTKNGIKNANNWNKVFLGVSLLSCLIFFVRYNFFDLINNAGNLSSIGISYGTIDIIWIQITTCILIFSVLLNNKLTFGNGLIIILYIILIAAMGKRAYIVNLLLCVLVMLYYIQYNKKINFKLIVLGFSIIGIVIDRKSVV